MAEEQLIRQGQFSPAYRTYHMIVAAFVLVVTLFGILLLPLLGLFWMYLQRQYEALGCDITEKFLKVRKGVLVKQEKNIPLEQITDMGITEGPLMRWLGIKQVTVETAGSTGQGALVRLIGLEDVESFRNDVLAQRDTLRGNAPTTAESSTEAEILATLQRIEALLERQLNG